MNNRLYRSPDDRVLAGVAGGMAEAYDLDPALTRLAWAVLIVISGGTLFLVYVIMALVVPVRPYAMRSANMNAGLPGANADSPTTTDFAARSADPNAGPVGPGLSSPPPGPPAWDEPRERRRSDRSGSLILGVLLVLVGAYLLARQFFPLLDIGRFWPVILIFVGLVLIVTAFGRRRAP